MSKLAVLLLIFNVTLAATTAQAGVDGICAGVESLKLVQSRSRAAQSIENPVAAIDSLTRLSADLRGNLVIFPNPELIRIDRSLFTATRSLRRAADPDHAAYSTLGALTFSTLTQNLADLRLIETTFGCQPSRPEGVLADLQTGARPSPLIERLWSVITDQSSAVLVYLGIALVMALLAVAAFFRRKFNRESVRQMCRIPLHIVYGTQCTVTVILDISLGGMKIEAPAADAGRDWAQFHFAGQKLEGRIVWRNLYYAGIEFRDRLNAQTLAAILEQNLKPLKDAGIENTSTDCFFPGCHVTCDRHLPTAISVKIAKPRTASD